MQNSPFIRSFRIYKMEDRANIQCWNHLMPLLAVGLENGKIQIFSVLHEAPIMSYNAHQGRITDLKWSSTGLFLASASEDGFIKIWSVP